LADQVLIVAATYGSIAVE